MRSMSLRWLAALIIQADVFNDILGSITVLPLTSTISDAPLFRITLDPSRQNGLNRVSQIMVDKVLTLPREMIGKRVGHLGNTLRIRVGRALSVWLGMSSQNWPGVRLVESDAHQAEDCGRKAFALASGDHVA
jgi:mRNA interferase MazF